MEQKVTLSNMYHERISGIFAYPKRVGRFPVVILAHGYGSSKGGKTNSNATEYLTQKGIGVFRFDFSGHGESEGNIEDLTLSKGVDEFRAAYQYVISQRGVDNKRIGVLGVSFGGNVGIIYAARFRGIRALALKSPISNYPEVRELELGPDKIREWREKGIIQLDAKIRSKYQFYEDACEIDTYRLAASLKCPVYVVQGDADEKIPLKHTNRLVKAIGRKARYTVIRGANHSYSNSKHFEYTMRVLNKFLNKELHRWFIF